MGDRCWLSIRTRAEDAERFSQAFGWGEKFEDWLQEFEQNGKTVSGFLSEVNYGAQTQLECAARLGAVFSGEHGEGGSYGAARFAGIDGKYHEYEVGHDGDPCVELNPKTLTVTAAFKKRLRAAMDAERKADKALDALEDKHEE